MGLAKSVYVATGSLPTDERFGLTSQLRKAAISVPSNIAEGCARRTTGEFLQFLGVAQGSLAELETQILLSIELGYLEQAQGHSILQLAEEVGRITAGLERSLERKHP